MMRTDVGSTLSRLSPSASTKASFVPSGENEGIITPISSLPSCKSSSPLSAITLLVAVLAREMNLDPGTDVSVCPPNTTYLPSGVSAEFAPYILVCFDKVAGFPGSSGRANAAQARVFVQLLYGATAGALAKSSTEATSVLPSALTEWQPMQRPSFSVSGAAPAPG